MNSPVPVVAFAAQAGSVGKTTSVVNLGALLAAEGHQVLVIDMDPQANATHHLGVSVGEGADRLLSTADLLKDEKKSDAAILQLWERAAVTTSVDHLLLLPANRDLDGVAIGLASQFRIGPEQQLSRLLKPLLATNSPLSLVLIDCPGTMSVLTLNALVAATAVVTCTKPTLKELQGIPEIEATCTEIGAAYGRELKLGAVIPCEVPASSSGAIYADAMALLESEYGRVRDGGRVTAPVRRSARVPEAYSHQVPLVDHAPLADVTQDYRDVREDLESAGILPKVG